MQLAKIRYRWIFDLHVDWVHWGLLLFGLVAKHRVHMVHRPSTKAPPVSTLPSSWSRCGHLGSWVWSNRRGSCVQSTRAHAGDLTHLTHSRSSMKDDSSSPSESYLHHHCWCRSGHHSFGQIATAGIAWHGIWPAWDGQFELESLVRDVVYGPVDDVIRSKTGTHAKYRQPWCASRPPARVWSCFREHSRLLSLHTFRIKLAAPANINLCCHAGSSDSECEAVTLANAGPISSWHTTPAEPCQLSY